MKKISKIVAIIFILIIAVMIIVPVFFKGQIAEAVKDQANKKLNAVINFDDIGLNMFQHFPDFTLSIDKLTLINKKPFEGDTLLKAKSFEATVDIWSVITGSKIKIKNISLDEPKILIYVLNDSTANYNIYKAADTSKANFNISLKKYSLDDADIVYVDQPSRLVVSVNNLTHTGSGDFSQDNFNIDTKTTIDELSVEKNNIPYLSKANIEFDMELNADIPSKEFVLKENELRVNNLQVQFEGSVQSEGKNTILNLKFDSPKNDFKDLISLIPAIYSKNFDNLKTSGKMIFNGSVNGTYNEETLPKININLMVENGSFKYPKLPASINNVQINLTVNNPGGKPDATIINLNKFHAELGKEPFDAVLIAKNPVTGPFIDAKIKGKINLSQLKNAVHLEGIKKLSGIINSDFSIKGIISDKSNYKNLDASGNINLNNIVYSGKDFAEEILINNASLSLTPQFFKLNNLKMKIGESGLDANGRLDNVIPYLLSDGILNGNINLTSNYFNVNPFLKSNNEEKDTSLKAVELPANINFTANLNFKKLIYDNLNLENAKGQVEIKNKRLSFNNVSANLLGGSLTLNGFYDSKNPSSPDISLNLAINNFDIQKTYKSFVTVKQFVPIAKYVRGSFSSNLRLNTALNKTMTPVWNSFNSSGSLSIPNAEIKGFKPFELIGDKLNIASLKDPAVKNIHTTYKINNGRFYLSPLDYKIANYGVSFAGSNGIDKSLDYVMTVDVPIGAVKSQVNQAVSGLLKKDVNLISSNNVKVNTLIKGQIDDPKLSFSAGSSSSEAAKSIKAEVKKEVNKKIEEKKEEVKKQVESKADTLKKELKKKAEEKIKDIFKKKFK